MENNERKEMKKGVSIIICTFNGASRLSTTIQHIAAQRTANLDWEVIFVDNASTDDSTEVVTSEWNKYGPSNVKLTKLVENSPGRIYALEKAFLHAQYEYSIMCDDDNWLNPDYVKLVYEILESNSMIGAVGGQSFAVNDTGVYPDWFEQYKDGYAVGQQNVSTGNITSRGYLWGAGMGTRTALYKEIYKDFPSILTGRKGDVLTAGEDSEYCQRLILRGYSLFYDSRLTFQHYIPASRLNKEYCDALYKGFEKSSIILSQYHIATEYITKQRQKLGKNTIFFSVATFFKCAFSLKKERRRKAKNTLIFMNLLPAKPETTMSQISKFYKRT